jgi:DNA-binding response OmpR family regulator
MRLLLIEDDPWLGQGIVDAITRDGTAIDWVKTGTEGLNALRMTDFDVAILDVGLPGLNGFDLLRQARSQGCSLPVLMLTARDQIDDRVTGLDAGADDYMIKPFDVLELKARIRALMRRHNVSISPVIEHNNIRLDPASHQVTQAGELVELSRREYALLLEFLSHPTRVFTRDFLMEKLYNWDDSVESNAIEVHIHHLRKKLGKDFIKTIRGIGYRIISCE